MDSIDFSSSDAPAPAPGQEASREIGKPSPESPQPAIEAVSETPKPEPNQEANNEVSEVKPENPEAIEAARKIEQATFEPEAVVEHAGDYKQAEALEAALVKNVDEAGLQPVVLKPEADSSDNLLEAKAVETTQRDAVFEDQSRIVTDNFTPSKDQPAIPQATASDNTDQAATKTLEAFVTAKPSEDIGSLSGKDSALEEVLSDQKPSFKQEAAEDKNDLTLEQVFAKKPTTVEEKLHSTEETEMPPVTGFLIPGRDSGEEDQSTQTQPEGSTTSSDSVDTPIEITDEEQMTTEGSDQDSTDQIDDIEETEDIEATEVIEVTEEMAMEALNNYMEADGEAYDAYHEYNAAIAEYYEAKQITLDSFLDVYNLGPDYDLYLRQNHINDCYLTQLIPGPTEYTFVGLENSDRLDDPSAWPSQEAYDQFIVMRTEIEDKLAILNENYAQELAALNVKNDKSDLWSVTYQTYLEARQEALEALTQLYGEERANEILNEATAQVEHEHFLAYHPEQSESTEPQPSDQTSENDSSTADQSVDSESTEPQPFDQTVENGDSTADQSVNSESTEPQPSDQTNENDGSTAEQSENSESTEPQPSDQNETSGESDQNTSSDQAETDESTGQSSETSNSGAQSEIMEGEDADGEENSETAVESNSVDLSEWVEGEDYQLYEPGQPGETLGSIADQFGISADLLYLANPEIDNWGIPLDGVTLVIPLGAYENELWAQLWGRSDEESGVAAVSEASAEGDDNNGGSDLFPDDEYYHFIISENQHFSLEMLASRLDIPLQTLIDLNPDYDWLSLLETGTTVLIPRDATETAGEEGFETDILAGTPVEQTEAEVESEGSEAVLNDEGEPINEAEGNDPSDQVQDENDNPTTN